MQGAVQGAPDHVCDWAVSGCCPGCCARDKGSKAEPEFNVLISIWGLCWCNFFLVAWVLMQFFFFRIFLGGLSLFLGR